MGRYEISFEAFLENFKKSASKLGYKNSIQKDYIIKILYFSDEHLSAQQIVNISKTLYKIDLGIATVYRTMKSFEKMNLVKSLDVGEGIRRYELNISVHHDHMVCTSCSKIIEFTDDLIEEQQKIVSKKHNFILKDHIMTIYGLCESCQK